MQEVPEDPLTELALRLKTLKAQRRLQMGGLQQRTGLGRTTVSHALNGHMVPSEATLVALATALDTDLEPLLALRRAAARIPRASENLPRKAVRRSVRPRLQPSFRERYLSYLAERHCQLTVVGLDLSHPDRAHWPLDAAYLSLELAQRPEGWPVGSADAGDRAPLVVKRAEKALADCRRVLLRGLAGSGKTTLLQWLAVATARDELPEELADWRGKIPFVLPLRTLMRRGPLPEPHDFLSAVGTPLSASQPEGWADDLLAQGEALVLVDGVDEVPQEHRAATRDWLGRLLAAYKAAHFVVTTRPSAVPDGWLASSAFTEFSVRPMSAADTGTFVGRWHAAARHIAATEAERSQLHDLEAALLVTVRAQRDLAQLSSTPLMCALICALHRDRRGHLPHSRMELYEAALSMLLVRRDLERSIDVPEGIQLTEHQSVQLLQRLAYWLIRNRQTEMDRATAVALVSDALPAMPAVGEQGTADQILRHLVGRSGLLRQPTADTIDFVHRTFQDYLGAKASVEAHDLPLLVNNAHDDQWEDVVRMAVAHARPTERAELLSLLIERGDDETEHRARLHLLAAASLPYATEVAPDTRQEVTTRAAALMPPRSTQEAAVLSALGPGILDLLPPTAEGLAQDEIQAVLRVAATMGGDQAYAYLQQFSSTLDHEVPLQELTLGWSNFEATDYARGILRPLRDRLHVTVRTPAQFEALPLLTPIKHISFSLALTPPEIMRHLSPEYTTSVSLRDMEGPRLQALSFVRSLTALRSLSLGPSTPVDGLDHLVGLPLQHLNLHDLPDGFSFQALSELSQLRELLLYTVLPWRTLHVLPAPPTLTRLWLGRWVEASVTGIAQWPTLEEVVVNHVMDAVEWDELGELGQLTDLHVTDPDFAGARVMETVNRLGVSLTRSDIRLDLIPDRFPNLERFSIHRSADVACDLTPLQPFTNLQIAVYNADRVALTGLEGFRAGQITLSPRPRLVSRSAPAQRAS